jgi:hypothetical protein
MIDFIRAIFFLCVGSFFVWAGAFSLIGSMLPHDKAIEMAEAHGKWCRENLFHLPPTMEGE